MKTLLLNILIAFGLLLNLNAQETIENPTSSDNLSVKSKDIIAALKEAGIQIFKFNTGEFKTKQEFILQLEEFYKDSLISKRVLYSGHNWYTTYDEKQQLIERFIDQIRVITNKKENNCNLSIEINGTSLNREFEFTKTYNRQFFVWRKYTETYWKLNERTPILAFISSWQDKRGFIRCCGPRELKGGDENTNKLFSDSPSYFVLSYIVKELES